MDPRDLCRIWKPSCPLTEVMYYSLFVPAPQEIGAAVAEPESAVHPTAEVLHRRTAHGGDHFRTQDIEELSEEAERLNQRWCDLEQEGQARGDPQYLAVVRSNISLEREAFQNKTNKQTKMQLAAAVAVLASRLGLTSSARKAVHACQCTA